MKARSLLLTAMLFLIVGFVSLGSKWNGSAGINAGNSLSAWSVSFNGSVHGLPALIGVLCLVLGVIVLVIAVIRALLD